MSKTFASDSMDEDWIVSEARNCRQSDISAAKSWLIVGRTLFPRNADMQVTTVFYQEENDFIFYLFKRFILQNKAMMLTQR
jgi:hypothetical protein